ncbi:HlyD family secretion protein [Arenibacter sp. GZD96]|uniref:HlyD family secretion protein n=1 Tax=Aurantibrevibacter litoralis TaxID=3106030 RepID=UPI002AFEB3D1|nr:HlyD family efflux transporter periplasmic adaptor subunit [Arenibacter sp. GZD-96]MEA1786113.1 HlyD family secretion protein [Arenibacter sp. GZD-96]
MANSLNDMELRSEEVREVLTDVPHWTIRWGNLTLLSTFLAFIGVGWFVKYPDTIEANAVLTTEVPPQKIFANSTGKLDTIHVSDEQYVSENSLLGVVGNTAITEDVMYLKSVMDSVPLDKKQLNFPIAELPILFLGDIELQFSNFENKYYDYLLNKELHPFSNEKLANTTTLTELRVQLRNQDAQLKWSNAELALKRKELERSKQLLDRGVISTQEFENKEVELLLAERNYANVKHSISQTRQAISDADRTSKGTVITETREEVQLLKGTLQSYNQLKKAIADWEHTYVLKSDIVGTVSFLNVWSKNQSVREGQLIFNILPNESSRYVCKIKAPSGNSGKIRIGQRVNISMDNFPESEYGVLIGEVSHISRTLDADGFYLVDVSLPNELITSYGKTIDFKHEMTGTAEIITEDLRLIERLFNQFRKVVD